MNTKEFAEYIYVYLSEKSPEAQLVTMTKSELEEIVRCLSESKNQRLCDRFQICNTLMPEQVKMALFKCERIIDPSGKRRCNEKEKLYSSREVFSKTCARNLYVGNCELLAREKKGN
ncbi:hypothetical protein HNY73_002760 [Argiope bruennichi]|uniref:Uncharacterized protein n=1 Tax=Argiope bruennichi TaxID=94029 RepID=A0A8T0FVT3_ARGBR|nr:hypothetical protein HNY73_002760 [Argiope bruennichi]